MRKKKEDIRDIYQGGERDFEKDFTPQVAHEQVESRKRDLRRSRIVSMFFGILVVVLSIFLIAIVLRDFLSERAPSPAVRAEEKPYIPRYSLPADDLWVMDHQSAPPHIEPAEKPGPKPLSTKWIKNAAYQIILGQQALALNRPKEALEHFQNVVEIYPELEGLHQAMGHLYLQSENYATAATYLELAVKEEESFDTVNNLGAAYLGLEKYDLAEKIFKRAAELQPENPGCHKNLGTLYQKMGRDNEAVFHFEKYLDLRPNDLDSMQQYALYLTKLGRWSSAADFLTKLTQEITDVAPLYFLLAQAQVQNGKEDKAIDALKRGVQLIDPGLALAWMSRDEFNPIRTSGEFKSLVDRLEGSSGSLEKK